MKRLLIFICGILFFQYSGNCQIDTYPRYYVQNGDTLGVIYTIQQVQKIYNDQVLLNLFKDVRLGCDSLFKRYLVVVNKHEQKHLVDKLTIEQYEKNQKEQDTTINLLSNKVNNLSIDLKDCDGQGTLQRGQIENYQKMVNKLKKDRVWFLTSTISLGALTLFLLGTLVGK